MFEPIEDRGKLALGKYFRVLLSKKRFSSGDFHGQKKPIRYSPVTRELTFTDKRNKILLLVVAVYACRR